MKPHPDVTFYRYFQKVPRPRELEHIKGRQDLDLLPADFRVFLTETRDAFNRSFALAEAPMAELGRPMVPYLDYLDSPAECAHAFESDGYHFIGISIPLIERLRDSAERLVRTEQVAALLTIPAGYVHRHSAIGGILSIKLLFVTAHEFGHHCLGHASDFRPESWNSVEDTRSGSLEQQAEENVADSYAVFLALGSLIDGPQGQQILEMLGHHSPPDADAILLSALLLSVFGFFSAKSGHALDAKTIYTLSHPPAFARVNGIINTTRIWCQQSRPQLDEWLTQGRLEEIMNSEERSRPGSEGLWAHQIEFFGSADGAEYLRRISEQALRMPPPGSKRSSG